MSHHRREWFLLRSRKTHSQVAEAHSFTRSLSPDVSRSTADRATSQSGRSSSSPSDAKDQPKPSRSYTRRDLAAPDAAASPSNSRSSSPGTSPEASAEKTPQIDSRNEIPSSYTPAARAGSR